MPDGVPVEVDEPGPVEDPQRAVPDRRGGRGGMERDDRLWVTQVAMEPVLVAAAVDRASLTHRLIAEGGRFSVNLWSRDDTRPFVSFSKPARRDGNTLNGRPVRLGVTGAPIFTEAIAYLDCRLWQAVDCGTHSLFLGRWSTPRSTTTGRASRWPCRGHPHEVRGRQAAWRRPLKRTLNAPACRAQRAQGSLRALPLSQGRSRWRHPIASGPWRRMSSSPRHRREAAQNSSHSSTNRQGSRPGDEIQDAGSGDEGCRRQPGGRPAGDRRATQLPGPPGAAGPARRQPAPPAARPPLLDPRGRAQFGRGHMLGYGRVDRRRRRRSPAPPEEDRSRGSRRRSAPRPGSRVLRPAVAGGSSGPRRGVRRMAHHPAADRQT